MSDFRTVCRVGDLEEGGSKTIVIGKKLIALFLDKGQYYAIDDVCPHMGASLSGGHLANGTVTCPWHAWRFRLADGAWADYPKVKIACYPVRVLGDEIQIDANGSAAPSSQPSPEA
jgi:nitrite reductase (NADH) small subunit/3-phenylpropionate/trans-cinnamate dioxygenase ferredoxin subunit